MVGAHEGDDVAPGELSHLGAALLAHRFLVLVAQRQNLFAAAFLDQDTLALGQRLFQHDQDDVVADRGPCLPGPAAGVVAKKPDDRVR